MWLGRVRWARAARLRLVARRSLTPLAFVVVWLALVLPDRLDRLDATSFVRLPVEGIALVGLSLALPPRSRRVGALVLGGLLGGLVVLKVLDMGFYVYLDRPFNPAIDWSSFGPALSVVRSSVGHPTTDLLVVLAIVAAVATVVLLALSAARVAGSVSRNRVRSARGGAAAGVVWLLCAVTAAGFVPGAPIAATASAGYAAHEVSTVRTTLHDQDVFARQLAAPDPVSKRPAADLLTALRGKDVLIVFVESYGQVAVQGTSFSPGVDAVLQEGDAKLAAAGFDSRSAFLRSPTFGGISWLAHSTLQSGLWINSQQRYDQLVAGQHYTLSDAFKRAGWRTVSDVPSDHGDWGPGHSFYHYDKLYNATNTGYAGPSLGYAAVPDQYSLDAFRRLELTPGHAPVMGEIDLVSSHTPWAPLPRLLPWDKLGNGSVYGSAAAQITHAAMPAQDHSQVRADYGRSVQYTMSALTSFIARSHDKNLVVVALGDHQPWSRVSGSHPNHAVPISIIAADPTVMSRIDAWQWQPGLLPHPDAPVWVMDTFRNRFLAAYSGTRIEALSAARSRSRLRGPVPR
jgi:hypothetical protein